MQEDCGRIPSLGDWLKTIRGERWMISPRGQDANDLAEHRRTMQSPVVQFT